MKYFIYILISIAIALMIYNATILDFSDLMEGDSRTALISILASSCVVVLLLILLVSRAIQKKSKNR